MRPSENLPYPPCSHLFCPCRPRAGHRHLSRDPASLLTSLCFHTRLGPSTRFSTRQPGILLELRFGPSLSPSEGLYLAVLSAWNALTPFLSGFCSPLGGDVSLSNLSNGVWLPPPPPWTLSLSPPLLFHNTSYCLSRCIYLCVVQLPH